MESEYRHDIVCVCRNRLYTVEDAISKSRSSCTHRWLPSTTVSADHWHQHCHVCWSYLLPLLSTLYALCDPFCTSEIQILQETSHHGIV